MSGHSKWSTIKHKKAAQDAKRGAAFGKIGKKIYLAVKAGQSGDPDKNPALRQVLDEARAVNMPSDNVRRAIDKGLGVGEGGQSTEITYEGYGPGGVGIIVTCVTDNKNRTGGEIKSFFEKQGGSLGGPGSVAYMQNMEQPIKIAVTGADKASLDQLLDFLENHEDVIEVWSNLDE